MSKANRKARFSIFNFFDMGRVTLPEGLDRKLVHLDYDEIIERIPQIKQALKDIKQRKRDETHTLNMMNKAVWTRVHLRPPKHHTRENYIQRGFNIAEKWNNERKDKEGIGEASETN